MGSLRLELVFLLSVISGSVAYVRFCYVPSWGQYRTGNGLFLPEDIDPFLCTHLLYSFLEIADNNLKTVEWNEEDMMKRVVKRKEMNPDLKVLVAIGGWTPAGKYFSPLVASQSSMQQFATNSANFLRQRNLDGLDLDWEYPGARGSGPKDVTRFTRFAQILHETFEQEAQATGKARLQVTAAVYGAAKGDYYEKHLLGNYLDYVSLMSYDFYVSTETTTNHHSLLYPESDAGRRYWTDAGFPASKLLLGMGTYGHAWKLSAAPSASNKGFLQPASGPASPGPYQKTAGSLQYTEICEKVKNEGWTATHLTDHSQAAVAYGQVNSAWEWTCYEDVTSLQPKLNYIQVNGMAGAMVWDMSMDDFRNLCGGGRYPILSAIQQALPDNVIPSAQPTQTALTTTATTATTATTTTTTTTTPRPPPKQIVVCPIENIYFGGSRARRCNVGDLVDSRPNIFYNVCFGRSLAITCRCESGFTFSLQAHMCVRVY